MQLLVSPSSLEEAERALAADIIDVKRPAEGSLGANFPWVIRGIKGMTEKPVSAAIGDFDNRPGGAALAALGAAAAGADYIKCGLMVTGTDEARSIIEGVVRAVKDDYPDRKVVIAAYSDFERLGTVSPFDVVPLAAAAGADVVMVDTGRKDGRSTFEFMDEAEPLPLRRGRPRGRSRRRARRLARLRRPRRAPADRPGHHRRPRHGLRRR